MTTSEPGPQRGNAVLEVQDWIEEHHCDGVDVRGLGASFAMSVWLPQWSPRVPNSSRLSSPLAPRAPDRTGTRFTRSSVTVQIGVWGVQPRLRHRIPHR